MKKLLPIAAFALLSQMAFAQSIDRVTGNFSSDLVYAVRANASSGKYENIKKGTPFFLNEWLPATVILIDGKQFDNILSKIDLLDHSFVYLEGGTEYTTQSRIKEVILKDTVKGKKSHFIHDAAFLNPVQKGDNGWYLQLASGDVSAYQYIRKKIVESRQYSSAITDRTIENNEKYFISYKNSLIPVKRLKDIAAILRDRENELNTYISKQGLNKVSSESIEKLVSYYNSLGKE